MREEERGAFSSSCFGASVAGASQTSCCSEPESFPGGFKTGLASAAPQLAAKAAFSMLQAKLRPSRFTIATDGLKAALMLKQLMLKLGSPLAQTG